MGHTFNRAVAVCSKFINPKQLSVMHMLCNGEDGAWFKAKFIELAGLFSTMPATYSQEEVADPIVYMHFFLGGADWWITERDSPDPKNENPDEQNQAFGLADLFGDGGELGYISIVELMSVGAELDLHWTPCPLSSVNHN